MLRKNQTKLIVIAALSLAIVSLSLVTMKMLTYEKSLTSKTGEKLALDDNAAALKKSSDFYRGIVLPGWRELTVSVDESCQATGIDFYNPADNLFYRCPRCLDVVAEKRCDKCEENYEKKELVEDCFYLRFSLILDDNDELIYQSGLVAPDLHLQSVNLTRVLEPGDYSATVLIEPYGKDMVTPLNQGEVKLVLHVKNLI